MKQLNITSSIKVKGSERHLRITSEVVNNRAAIRITGYIHPWGKNNDEDYSRYLQELEDNGITEIDLYVNSGGGYVFVANEIANANRRFKGTVHGLGGALVASAATTILLSTNKLTRKGTGNMQMMIHRPMTLVEGNEDQLQSDLNLLQNLQKTFLKDYAENSTLSEEEINTKWKSDWWMTASEAKGYGFIAGIAGTDEPEPEEVSAIMSSYEVLPTAVANVVNNLTPDKNQPIMKDVQAALGLGANATEAEVLAGIKALKDRNAELQMKLNDQDKAAKQTKAEALVDKAIADKRIQASARDKWVRNALSDYGNTEELINGLPPMTKLTDSIQPENTGAAQDGSEKWDYEQWQKNDRAGLIAMIDKEPDRFKKLFKAHYGYEYKA